MAALGKPDLSKPAAHDDLARSFDGELQPIYQASNPEKNIQEADTLVDRLRRSPLVPGKAAN